VKNEKKFKKLSMRGEGYFTNRKVIIPILITLIIAIFGTSYALWQITLQQTDNNVITTGCFKLTMEGQSSINVDKVHPYFQNDDFQSYLRNVGIEPYEFKITNTCTESGRVTINLESLDFNENRLDDKYINVFFNDKRWSQNIIPEDDNKLIFRKKNERTISKNALNSYQLETIDLLPGESREFELILYMASDAPPTKSVINKTFKSKITIDANEILKDIIDHTIKDYNHTSLNIVNGYDVQKIVFQNQLSNFESNNIIDSWDSSINQSGKIMTYIIKEAEKLVAYIQSDGKFYLPSDSSFLFRDLYTIESIEGLNLVDTSRVTNMKHMFQFFGKDSSFNFDLDLSNFNTSQVIDMSFMFAEAAIKSLNLNNFNTKNVRFMENMFEALNLETGILDISNFDGTSVVNTFSMFCNSNIKEINLANFIGGKIFDMSSMFAYCSSLISLNLSNLNTENTKYMMNMFSECSSLTSLDLSSFNTHQVTDMSHMFDGCSSLTSLDVSSFDTSNVEIMEGMFRNCSSLTSLDLSSFNTRKIGNILALFKGCEMLSELNIENFDTRSVYHFNFMLAECINLTHVTYGSKFIYKNLLSPGVSGMFDNCPANKPTHESWLEIFPEEDSGSTD